MSWYVRLNITQIAFLKKPKSISAIKMCLWTIEKKSIHSGHINSVAGAQVPFLNRCWLLNSPSE